MFTMRQELIQTLSNTLKKKRISKQIRTTSVIYSFPFFHIIIFEYHKSNLNTIVAINNGLIETDIEERFNFKPIYAAASLIPDVDLTTIQNFEQSFFNDYQLLKQAYKKFK